MTRSARSNALFAQPQSSPEAIAGAVEGIMDRYTDRFHPDLPMLAQAVLMLRAAQPQVIEGYVNPDGSGKGNWWKGGS